jgi:toxin YhaV
MGNLSAYFANGWQVFSHPLFLEQIAILRATVERLALRDPENVASHRDAKILAAISKMAFEVIPGDPSHPMFRQGDTLGPSNRHWRRAKFFAGRYRLFFQFNTAQRAIVLAWVNDEDSLRTYGKKTDAYAVFKTMLGRNRPPSDWPALLKEALDEQPGALRIVKIISRSK